MWDDGWFFPFILMNSGKHLSNWLTTLLQKLLMADVVKMAVFVFQLLRWRYEEDILTITFQASLPGHTGGFHKLLGISFKRVCERNSAMLHKELCSI